jgi:hypothetical protein
MRVFVERHVARGDAAGRTRAGRIGRVTDKENHAADLGSRRLTGELALDLL